MANQEQHLTMARLSAYIDEQLSAEELRQTEAHLQHCVVCQQQLAGLRQTVALLRALPKPALPRSFVLPSVEVIHSTQQVPRLIHSRSSATASSRRSQDSWVSRASGTIRVLSSLAALVGIFLLFSGLLGTIIPVNNGSNSARSTISQGGTSTPGPVTSHALTPHITNHESPSVVPPTKSSTATSSNGHTTPVSQPAILQALLDMRTLAIRVALGLILLAASILGFILLARRI